MSLFLHQIWSIASVSHQWMLCSEWVPSKWESKQLIKHLNNPRVIYSSPSVNVLRRQKMHVLTNKSNIKRFWTSNLCFWLKYKSFIHNIFSSSEKNGLVWIRRQIKQFSSQNSCKLVYGWILMWETTGDALWRIVDSRSDGLKSKCRDEFVLKSEETNSSKS